ncbi:hypothetical protein B7494_g6939 [Chlorociboria aeruginascens]|nr:hypothetical protein B7494_g6939 [Chlorociboria aeruginascens]
MAALDNANPTILSVSELPSRRQGRKARDKSGSTNIIRDLALAKPAYMMDPFYMSEFSDSDSDESTVEPIDEQEIYGVFYSCPSPQSPNSAQKHYAVVPISHIKVRLDSVSASVPNFCSQFTYPILASNILRFVDLIAPIEDPEHPLSLESLGVVKLQDVHLASPTDLTNPAALSRVLVELTPTVTHCSLATVIGLGVRVRLEQALPPSYRVEVKIKEGSHSQAAEVNKQLADKERVAAALENANLMGILKKMLQPCLVSYV